jgi:hypothetical protein
MLRGLQSTDGSPVVCYKSVVISAVNASTIQVRTLKRVRIGGNEGSIINTCASFGSNLFTRL